jgi:hypothetical protein
MQPMSSAFSPTSPSSCGTDSRLPRLALYSLALMKPAQVATVELKELSQVVGAAILRARYDTVARPFGVENVNVQPA